MEQIHLVGIGGTGLSAIALVLLERGFQVSGSDLTESVHFNAVKEAGAQVFLGHRAEYIQGADLVIRSSAIPDDNVEVAAAGEAGIPVLKRAEYLGQLLAGKEVLAVAGSHGKTTTTSMLVWILNYLGVDPSFIVGGVVSNLGVNAHSGAGKNFVIEADEYDYMFWGLTPDIALITNVEHDHPDIFPTSDDFTAAFEGFVENLVPGGKLILCGEDPGALKLQDKIRNDQKAFVYGFEGSDGDYIAHNLLGNARSGLDFEIEVFGKGDQTYTVSLQVPGEHNVLNALGAFAAADQIGLDRHEISRALSEFEGSERRFEVRGEYQGVLVVDDYAHHPTEILMTLQAARSVYPGRRIWAVWQPHTYSRTVALFDQFTTAFLDADRVIVLDVYSARETKPDGFEITKLVASIDHPKVDHIAGIDEAAAYLQTELAPADLLLVFTAGDAIEINNQIEEYLKIGAVTNKGEES